MDRKIVKISCISLIVVVIGLAAWMVMSNAKKEEETRLFYEQMNEQLLPIQNEIYELRKELTDLEMRYVNEKKQYATVQLLFTAPMAEIYTTCYQFMKAYDYVGIIAVSEEYFPGNEGCITAYEAELLGKAGWQFCMRYDGGSFDALKTKAEESGFTLLNAVYFMNGSFDPNLEIIREMDYVIHHGEHNTPLITSDKDERWYLGAMGWYIVGVSNVLNETVEDHANIVYTIGPDGDEEGYESGQFKGMLQTISKKKDTLVTDLTSLDKYQGEEADEAYELEYEKAKNEIEDKIEALKKQENAIYDEFQK